MSDTVTKLYNAVYSPCAVVCDDGKTPKTPLWQIEAEQATIDKAAQTITYHDAYMDIYGLPVLYTPYMSQATPGADNKSGVLMPQYHRNSNLGDVVELPLYWAIAPDRDLTLTPMYMTLQSPLLFGEYRERFNEGLMKLDGSITSTHSVNSITGDPEPGDSLRWHLFGDGNFALSSIEDWGFSIRRTSDETYLREYDINYDPLLTSRIYAEDFGNPGNAGDSGRNYGVAQMLAFQGMQLQDNPQTTPLVLPLVDMYYETLPMAWNSRLSLSGGFMSLTREVGDDSRRLSAQGRWTVPYVTSSGQILDFAASLRADGYDVNDLTLPSGQEFNGTSGRVVRQSSLQWRYPLINRFASSNVTIEPVVQTIISPSGGNPSTIPNEDSAVPEFTDTNLFSEDRFAGYDRVETGPRVNYGLRGQWFFDTVLPAAPAPPQVNSSGPPIPGGGFVGPMSSVNPFPSTPVVPVAIPSTAVINALFGQAWRQDNDPLFPLSGDPTSHFSDYVGMFGVNYQPVSISYRYRLDKDNFAPVRNEVDASVGWPSFGVGGNYLDTRHDPVIADQNQLSVSPWVKIGKYWTLTVGADRDFLRNAFVSSNAALTYQNECITVQGTAGHNFTSDRDFSQGTTVKVQVFFKNLQ